MTKQHINMIFVTIFVVPILAIGVILYILGIPVWFMNPSRNTIFHKLNWYGSGAIVIAIYGWLGAYDSTLGKGK